MKTEMLDVYLARVPDTVYYSKLYPDERDKELREVNNIDVKKQKYCAWRLLAHAIKHSLGLDIEKLNFTKVTSGKWICPACEFSISHSGKLVAVAISTKPVGIDIQIKKTIASSSFIDRMLTDGERELLAGFESAEDKEAEVLKIWTKKESIFKASNLAKYIPAEIETTKYNFYEDSFTIDGECYYLSVAGKSLSKIKIFEDVIF